MTPAFRLAREQAPRVIAYMTDAKASNMQWARLMANFGVRPETKIVR